MSGRYLQDFKIKDLVISPRVNESTVRPFYEGKPLLEDLALDLSVRTVGEGFIVQNNIAPEIRVDILLHVGGTLSRAAARGRRPPDGRPLQHPVHARRLRSGPQRQPRHVHRHQVDRRRRDAGPAPRGDQPGHRRERQRPQRAHAHQRPDARGAHRSVQRRRPGSQPGGDAADHRTHRLRFAARVDAEPDGRRQRRRRWATSAGRSRATRSTT